MRKVQLRMKESLKYEIIKELVDHDGNKKRAALKLNITVRQVNRLISVYKTKGKAGFVHGNRNRQPSNSLPQELVNRIINLYNDLYQGFNFMHFSQKLNDEEGISVSYKTIYTLLTSNEIYPPKEHKATRRKRAITLLKARKPDIHETDIEIAAKHEMNIIDAHPRKSRAKYFGEEIQMDGSIHRWFGDIKTTLHLAIDNATGIVVGGYFAKEETLDGYYRVFQQILSQYGVPAKFLTDNRTVFNYKTALTKTEEKDVLTQFGYACRQLGTDIETSSVSQYKGQIERANGTFQDRLVSEFRKAKINNIDSANKYLSEIFIPDFNKRFAMDYNKFESVMENPPGEEEINRTLAVCAIRKFDNGSAISYKNKLYQATNEDGNLICFIPGTECLVIVALDKTMYVTVDDKVYLLKEVERNKKVSEEFDIVVNIPKPKKKYIPPMTHPWKAVSFKAQQKSAHVFHRYAG